MQKKLKNMTNKKMCVKTAKIAIEKVSVVRRT